MAPDDSTGQVTGSSGPGDVPDAGTRRSNGRIICLIGLIAASLALSLQWLAKYNLVFDIFSHFTLHYVLAALAFLIGFFMPRARVLTAFIIIVAGVGAIAWWPQYISRQPPETVQPANGERSLKLMTFNTWSRNKDWRAVAAEIRRLNPDIVTLVEFGREKQKAFDDLKKDYPYSVHCIREPYCHLAMLSKVPLYDVKSRAIWRGPALIRARLGKKFGRVHVFGIHSTRPPFVRSQIIQLLTMGDHLRKRYPGPKIVMGDFNATPYANLLHEFTARSGMKRVTNLPTWPARFGPFPQLAIDHVFLSPGIRRLSNVIIGRRAGSDHYPTAVEVAVKVKP